MSDVYDSEALWLKARLFVNHAMDHEEPRTFDEHALWASLALELLAKAALARVNPLLIAMPNEEGAHLLAASGLLDGDGPAMTVGASTVFKRCARVFRPFNLAEALQFANNRNQYLHSGAATVTSLPETAFWPAFWSQAAILILAQDRDISEFVGADRADEVEAHLARNRQHVEQRVETLIGRARQHLDLIASGNAPERILAAYRRGGDLRAGLRYSTEASCPACSEIGTVEGEQPEGHELRYEQVGEDDFDVFADVSVYADYFSCANCRLVLDDAELLEVAGLVDLFDVEGDPAEFVSGDYGND
ncbi:MAG: hypothetical protein QOI54_803 [Actinomycetota bacterium]|jgi:hypothetical protein|nr:hypothetical protein [Actinomycetota bacterium]